MFTRKSSLLEKKTLSDLFAMTMQSGIPTFFCTFSSAELSRWPEVIECIARQEGENAESSPILYHRGASTLEKIQQQL